MDKFVFSDIFKSRDERNTIFIAFLVLIFFGWLIYHLGFSSVPTERELATLISDPIIEEKSDALTSKLPEAVVAEEVVTEPEDRDGDGIFDDDDKCPDETGGKDTEGCPVIELEEKEKATLALAVNALQFQLNKATLKKESYLILNDILDILKKYPDHRLRIEGHTDNLGAATGNLKLSKNRAAACYEFFTARGVSNNRLEYEGYGETHPVAPNNTPAGRAKNRRVQFSLLEQ